MAIHLVQRSQAYAACRAVANADDVVVLLGEGVAALLNGATAHYASQHDLEERGLSGYLTAGCQPISDVELVALCAEHAPAVSWSQP